MQGKATAAARFWAKVDRSGGADACWPWMRYRNAQGYGRIHLTNGRCFAHRYSWILANGPVPFGLFVLHKCDNPSCVNPSHLFLGTLAENNADRDQKGRQAKGANTGPWRRPPKLGPALAAEIRALRGQATQREIAEQYGVSESTIRGIHHGKLWRESWWHDRPDA